MYASNIVKEWRRYKDGYGIIGSKCSKCSSVFFPSRNECEKCKSREIENFKFSGKGVLYSFSKVHISTEEFRKFLPYNMGIIELEEGQKVVAELVECSDPKIGMKFEACIRKLHVDGQSGLISYGVKFRPLLE